MKLTRSQERTALVAAILHGLIALVCYAIAHKYEPLFPTHFLMQTGNVLLVAALVSFLAAFHAYIVRLAREEKRESERYRENQKSQLFGNSPEESGRYHHSLRQFEKIILPIVILAISVVEIGVSSWVITMELDHVHEILPKERNPMLSIASVMSVSAVISFIVSKYCSGLAFGNDQHYLRSISGYTLYASVVCALGLMVSLLFFWGFPVGVVYLTWATCIGSLLLALERIITWVIDLYRPKSKQVSGVMVYESRFLGLFTQPQGILRNVSDLIDYQFGIQISEGLISRCLVKIALPFVLLQLFTLSLLSCIIYIQPHETGLLEQWGTKSLATLDPGLHFKLPWPVCRVYRVATERVHHVRITSDDTDLAGGKVEARGNVSLWSSDVDQSNLFLAASSGNRHHEKLDRTTVSTPVNLAIVNATLLYTIADSNTYITCTSNPPELIKYLGLRELKKYMISHDFPSLLRTGIERMGAELAEHIQRTTDANNLGIKVLAVTIDNLQPPSSVVGSYRAVIEAHEDRRRRRLESEQYAAKTLAEADQEANSTIRKAEGDTALITKLAEVEKLTYHQQYTIYKKYPELYKTRSTMDTLEEWLQDVRKIVATTGNAREVINLELKRTQPDLLSVPLD